MMKKITGFIKKVFDTLLSWIFGLRIKLIVPYFVLTLLIALGGIFIITRLMTGSVEERFTNQLTDASKVASDVIATQENYHLENLRTMAYTIGVPEAMADKNSELIEALLHPVIVNEAIQSLSVVDLDGIEILSIVQNPETGEDTLFDVLQIKVYPANPTVPILLVNIEHRVAGDERFGGFLDLAPVAMSPHDLGSLQKRIKSLTEGYGGDYESLRKRVVGMYNRDHWKNALNAGIGIRLELSPEQFHLVQEAGNKWLEWYCGLLEETASKPFTRDEEALMYHVRSGILEFYMLQDQSFQIIQQLGVPLETMALAHFAPTIHY